MTLYAALISSSFALTELITKNISDPFGQHKTSYHSEISPFRLHSSLLKIIALLNLSLS